MKLSINKLAAACSLVLGAAAANANQLTDFGAGDVVVYAGGATATDNVLENMSRAQNGGYCVAGTIDIYTAANQRAVFCETNGTRVAGFPNSPNTQVAFLKESAGGSSNGVVPLIAVANGNGHTLRWLDLATLRTTNGCTTTALLAADTGQTGLLNVTRRWNCAATLTPVDTAGSSTFDVNMGVSDTEPALSFPKPSATDIARLAVAPAVHISFGVPVTLALYTALQQAQGLAASEVPSLSRSQIRGLFSGSLFDWNQITDNNGDGLAESTLVTTPPANTSIYVCRRVASSGTQATAEAYWFSQRCISGGTVFVEPNDGSTTLDTSWVTANAANGTVNAGPSSTNVRSCLNNYNNANVWGLGVLSNEIQSGQMTGFRMIAIDGVAPTLANTANGLYDYYSESVTTSIAQGNPGFINTSNTSTDLRGRLIRHIQTNISEPVTLAQINSPFVDRPWGNGGSLAIPNGVSAIPNASPTDATAMLTNPVDTSTKFGNNCSGAVTIERTPVL
jgi:hypothetical protein